MPINIGVRLGLESPPADLTFRRLPPAGGRKGVEDEEDVRQVAAEWVTRYGADAARRLRELAREADRRGDALSAEAWDDIADAVEELRARG
jgi:hypothetical protein